jgi:hypothetical protein
MRKLVVVMAIAMLATVRAEPASAQDRLNGGGDAVPIWRDMAAYREGLRLINAGVHTTNPALVMRLLSCMAPDRSQIVITDAGLFSSTVVVTSGPRSGCRGIVANEEIARAR